MRREILIEDLPRECIDDCGMGAGAKDEAVASWLKDSRVAALMDSLSPDAMRVCLRGYGAWEDNELQDDAQNKARILWLACGTFAEYICECERAGIDPYTYSDRPDTFEPSAGSDLFSLE